MAAARPWLPAAGLNEDQERAAAALEEAGQQHIFEAWGPTGEDDDRKLRLLDQAAELDASYPGGLRGYRASAVELLQASQRGENPLAGYTATVPEGRSLFRNDPQYDSLTEAGVAEFAHCGFVLVAGGLGERLGYPEIKLSLPVETATEECYLSLYCAALKAWGEISGARHPLPLVLMTSDDTHEKTQQLLREQDNFGLAPGQITLVKQGKVPALANGAAHFATAPGDPYTLLTKPHGHGDVHQLLHQHGIVKRWLADGIRWAVFFQDTHGLMIRKLPGMMAVSAQEGFAMNSMSIPRKPGEAVGALCRLQREDGGPELTINVEYNQLEPLLQATAGTGDVPDLDGFSKFPGNVNTLVLALEPYAAILERDGGKVPEFVNPKYTDSTRSAFKSPTRLECMMQDIAKSFPPECKVGFSCFERALYSPVKNATADGAAKQKDGQLPACAAVAEADWYCDGARMLQLCGVKVESPPSSTQQPTFLGVKWTAGARVVLHPSFAPTLPALRKKIGEGCSISNCSTLVVKGTNVRLERLSLNGALIIEACEGAHVTVDELMVRNEGWPLVPLAEDEEAPAALRIRGYRTDRSDGALVLRFPTPGTYQVPAPPPPPPAPPVEPAATSPSASQAPVASPVVSPKQQTPTKQASRTAAPKQAPAVPPKKNDRSGCC
eukprot:TRINITY_DN17055_c0_g1_i1.p1 TRINITY_DN17055_c0_g1~~TRINITY_DN17055_c0_g1_i1.p1  ORF type:complete len:697 (+),score=202.60 TRINITY_DN17055_c0_g1_i1:92-2092(+)